MATSNLPGDGEVRLGSVTLPAGRRVRNLPGNPVAWATIQPVAQAGRVWSTLSGMIGQTGLAPVLLAGLRGSATRPWDEGEFDYPADISGLDHLDAANVLAAGWEDSVPGEDEQAEEDTDAAAELAPFSWGFPGLAMPGPTRLSEADLQPVLDALPAARVGLIPAARPADALPLLGWTGAGNHYQDALPLAAVLRSWEDRFGARLLQVGFAEIRLLVERPPRDVQSAERVAAEHYAFCDECGGKGLTTISEISINLVNAPIWTFWWD